MPTSKLNIEQCGACLGAVVTNINLTSKISNQEKVSLRAALDQHQVIFFQPEFDTQPSVTEWYSEERFKD